MRRTREWWAKLRDYFDGNGWFFSEAKLLERHARRLAHLGH